MGMKDQEKAGSQWGSPAPSAHGGLARRVES
jgi:hypothetical protein